ncbi:hypothetical protein [Streptomyces gobiensis]|uniref:hypothetical protein n=1 Tax=Streptomyces gobiensis TaxID=2875706 RepID=UPI001E44726A|nr:hypothetical protein [Streptomyces gobiensis]UGY92850.1 hypothetical protein test1122_14815 [Streptomyces gobiensis]
MGFWFVLLVIFILCGGGAWLVENLREALRTRHERRLALIRADERRVRELAEASRPPEPPEPVCGCTHHLAIHDKQGMCHAVVEVPTGWDADHKPLAYEPGMCRCQQYVGPQPLSQVWAEDITDKGDG